MSCLAECSPELVGMVLQGCTVNTMPGGIRAFAFKKCDASFDDDVSAGGIGNVQNWETLVEAGALVFTGKILGSQSAPTNTELRTSSCSPPQVTGQSFQYTVVDYNHDSDGATEVDFWNNKQFNFASIDLYAITCDEWVYEYKAGEWSIVSGEVRETTKEEARHIDSTITINKLGMTKPVKVIGITSILP